MSPPYYTGCRECGSHLNVVYLCIHCAQPFCSQDCFRNHVATHIFRPSARPPAPREVIVHAGAEGLRRGPKGPAPRQATGTPG